MRADTWVAALLDPARPVPQGLRTWNGSDPAVRFGVHRNNVMAGLVATLGEALPVLRRFVGEAYFAALARVFIGAHPPCTPVLAEWGDDFAPWLESFAPAADWPCLPDLARLERARTHAFHAADAAPVSAEGLARLAANLAQPTQLPQTRLLLQPSLRALHSAWAVAHLWAVHQSPEEPEHLHIDGPEGVIVLRDPAGQVQVLVVPVTSAQFCADLAARHTLGEALTRTPGVDLVDTFTLLIHHGAIVAWQATGEPS